MYKQQYTRCRLRYTFAVADEKRFLQKFLILTLLLASDLFPAPVPVRATSAVGIGFRSALSQSFLKNSFFCRPSSPQSSKSKLTSEDDSFVESAFFRPKTAEDVRRLYTSESAYLKSSSDHSHPLVLSCVSSKSVESTTEEDILDSLPSASASSSLDMTRRGGASAATLRPLVFWENMVCGAISRSIAQTVMHPANSMKTILQSSRGPQRPTIAELLQPKNFRRLSRGAGANFLLSVPHGAVNFAVLEFVRRQMADAVSRTPFLADRAESIGPGLDFLSSALSTITCSIVSTPQMMVTDNIMAGNYPNLVAATKGLAQNKGIMGFYAGWWPGLVGKIPSYALTWTFFQQLKRVRGRISDKPVQDIENSIMGCIASGTTVCIMIPMDTIKTRLVTQTSSIGTDIAYKGIIDCAVRVFREEGIGTFYRGLAPRLVSVVPMIGIQFGVYEFMKKVMIERSLEDAKSKRHNSQKSKKEAPATEKYGRQQVLENAAMEVAASPEHPYPAPQFSVSETLKERGRKIKKQAKQITQKIGSAR